MGIAHVHIAHELIEMCMEPGHEIAHCWVDQGIANAEVVGAYYDPESNGGEVIIVVESPDVKSELPEDRAITFRREPGGA